MEVLDHGMVGNGNFSSLRGLACFYSQTTMKRNLCCLPVPQWEFGFTQNTFNLIVETGVDGNRVARERAEADEARLNAGAVQAGLFSVKLKTAIRQRGHQND
jgi:hypothetical protein